MKIEGGNFVHETPEEENARNRAEIETQLENLKKVLGPLQSRMTHGIGEARLNPEEQKELKFILEHMLSSGLDSL